MYCMIRDGQFAHVYFRFLFICLTSSMTFSVERSLRVCMCVSQKQTHHDHDSDFHVINLHSGMKYTYLESTRSCLNAILLHTYALTRVVRSDSFGIC